MYSQKINRLFKIKHAVREAHIELFKSEGKKTTRSLGIEVPETILCGDFVVKPDRGSQAISIYLVHNDNCLFSSKRVLVEELLIDKEGHTPPTDYKFYCFSNEPKLVQVIRRCPFRVSYHDPRDWMNIEGVCEREKFVPEKPENLAEMCEIAIRLSRIFFYPVRVDLYNTTKGIVFGEFCLTSGLSQHILPEYDKILDGWWSDHFFRMGIEDEFDHRHLAERGFPDIFKKIFL